MSAYLFAEIDTTCIPPVVRHVHMMSDRNPTIMGNGRVYTLLYAHETQESYQEASDKIVDLILFGPLSHLSWVRPWLTEGIAAHMRRGCITQDAGDLSKLLKECREEQTCVLCGESAVPRVSDQLASEIFCARCQQFRLDRPPGSKPEVKKPTPTTSLEPVSSWIGKNLHQPRE